MSESEEEIVRRKARKKKVCSLSSENSSDDEVNIAPKKNLKNMILSDEEDIRNSKRQHSDSSGSYDGNYKMAQTKKVPQKKKRIAIASNDDDDSDYQQSNENQTQKVKRRRSARLSSKAEKDMPSSSCDEQSDDILSSPELEEVVCAKRKITNEFVFGMNRYRTEDIRNKDDDFIVRTRVIKKVKRKRLKPLKSDKQIELRTNETRTLRSRTKSNKALEKFKLIRSTEDVNERAQLKNIDIDDEPEDINNIDRVNITKALRLCSSDENFIDDENDSEDETFSVVEPGSETDDSLSPEQQEFLNCVKINDETKLAQLLDENHNLINTIDRRGQTALHLACILGHSNLIETLLKHNADPRSIDVANNTPIFNAAINKRPACFNQLLPVSKLYTLSESIEQHNVVHLLAEPCSRTDDKVVKDFVECMNSLRENNINTFYSYLNESDNNRHLPLMVAIESGNEKIVEVIFNHVISNEDCKKVHCQFRTEEGGNMLHFAAQHEAGCLEKVLAMFLHSVNTSDSHGFTPLMYACELEKCENVEQLLKAGSSLGVSDTNGVTALHLAAARNSPHIVEQLLAYGHRLDVTDKYGWPPLLYANFQADESLVLQLMEKDPKQVFCLGRLLSMDDDYERREKNIKVIKETLYFISRVDSYYTVFNDFISHNLSLLDENNNQVFVSTWKHILNFENKLKWMRLKLNRYTFSVSYCQLSVKRDAVLRSVMQQLPQQFNFNHTNVSFVGEAGTCLGPKREFLSCLVNEITSEEHNLFTKLPNNQYIACSTAYFLEMLRERHKESTQFLMNLKQAKESNKACMENKSQDNDHIGNKLEIHRIENSDAINNSSAPAIDVNADLNASLIEAVEDASLVEAVNCVESHLPVTTSENKTSVASANDFCVQCENNLPTQCENSASSQSENCALESRHLNNEVPLQNGSVETCSISNGLDSDINITVYEDSLVPESSTIDSDAAILQTTKVYSANSDSNLIVNNENRSLNELISPSSTFASDDFLAQITEPENENNLLLNGPPPVHTGSSLVSNTDEQSDLQSERTLISVTSTAASLFLQVPCDGEENSTQSLMLETDDGVTDSQILRITDPSDSNTTGNGINSESVSLNGLPTSTNVIQNLVPSNLVPLGNGVSDELIVQADETLIHNALAPIEQNTLISAPGEIISQISEPSTAHEQTATNKTNGLSYDTSLTKENCLQWKCATPEELKIAAEQAKLREYEIAFDEKLEQLEFIGSFVAEMVISEDHYINLQLANSFINQLLNISYEDSKELSACDHDFYTSISTHEMDGLEQLFSLGIINPWTHELEEIFLDKNKDKVLSDENKFEYLECVGKFKFKDSVKQEIEAFKEGFYKRINHDVINIFNADEFSLLLNGVTTIDIEDWKRNTKYTGGYKQHDGVIVWFWATVVSMKEEERSLLLKFVTGSPCLPAGGFKMLQGLGGGHMKFTISTSNKKDKLPGAATCFNRLNLPQYSSENNLRTSLLIAVRHGSEGFAFG